MHAEQAEFHVTEREQVDPTELVTEPDVALWIEVVVELVDIREHRSERHHPRCQFRKREIAVEDDELVGQPSMPELGPLHDRFVSIVAARTRLPAISFPAGVPGSGGRCAPKSRAASTRHRSIAR